MPKYEIIVDESQRQFLITCLTQCQLQNYFGATTKVEREAVDDLAGMFERLSVDNTTNYGVVNDFTE